MWKEKKMNNRFSIVGIVVLIICVGLSGCEEIHNEIFEKMAVVTFTVEPSIIEKGETANLSWAVTGSDTTVTIDNNIGNVSLTGHRIISPNKTITYTLTASNLSVTKTATTHIIVKNETVEDEPEYNETNGDDNGDENEETTNPIAVITTSMGTMRVELFEDKVPNTCENFIKLANDGFYDSLVFHRVIDDFMIQGGGYTSDGTHKESPYGTIDLEIHPEVRHVDGAIAMARTPDPDSATSQFYICDGAQSFLDDNYAAFGIVIEGTSVLRTIVSVDTATRFGMQDWPLDNVIINSITIENQ